MNEINLIDVLKQFRDEWPPLFAGVELDKLTCNAYRWRTLQNEKCLGLAPVDIFLRSGERKLLIIRDKFLVYWQQKLKRE